MPTGWLSELSLPITYTCQKTMIWMKLPIPLLRSDCYESEQGNFSSAQYVHWGVRRYPNSAAKTCGCTSGTTSGAASELATAIIHGTRDYSVRCRESDTRPGVCD